MVHWQLHLRVPFPASRRPTASQRGETARAMLPRKDKGEQKQIVSVSLSPRGSVCAARVHCTTFT